LHQNDRLAVGLHPEQLEEFTAFSKPAGFWGGTRKIGRKGVGKGICSEKEETLINLFY